MLGDADRVLDSADIAEDHLQYIFHELFVKSIFYFS